MAAPALQGDLNESHLRSRPGAQPMWGGAVPQGRRLLAAPKKAQRQQHSWGPRHSSAIRKPPPKPVLLQPCQSLLQQHRGRCASLWLPPCCHQAAATPRLPLLLLHLTQDPNLQPAQHSRSFPGTHRQQSGSSSGPPDPIPCSGHAGSSHAGAT